MERVIVVGSGGTGSAAALSLARDGTAVTLLERFAVDHDRGSSYGASRVIRRVYPDDLYTRLMDDAYTLWEALEADAGETLLLRTGGIFFGPSNHPEIDASLRALEAVRVPHKVVGASEARIRWPAFRFTDEETVISQPDTGVLRASACVRAQVRLAARAGADVRENAPVERFELYSGHIDVRLKSGESISCDRVILAAGPWMRSLLAPHADLPLAVTRQVYCHFEPERDDDSFDVGRFPVWIDLASNLYGFPRLDGLPGVKTAFHVPGAPVADSSLARDKVDREVQDTDRDPLRQAVRLRLPGLSPQVTYEKVCLYTNTPDEDFLLDTLPGDARVVLASGCSGHGFKFTALLGLIAANLARGGDVPWNLNRFRLDRFNSR